MTTDLTNDGIMVSEGCIIAENVTAKVRYNGEENLVTLHYVDMNGIQHSSVKNAGEYTMMMDHGSKTIDGILSKNDNWYLFWDNLNNLPIYGLDAYGQD